MGDPERQLSGTGPAGDELARAAAVVDRLVSPGGCPWDAAQTHGSLAPYLLEEAHEAVEEIESVQAALDAGHVDGVSRADAHLVDELGDVLLQVLLHARLAEGRGAFGLGDVARALADKLVRRHPHVFERAEGEQAPDAARLRADWERLKAAESPHRGRFDGIPAALPALARAAKVAGRLRRDGLDPRQVLARADLGGGPAGEIGAAAVELVLAARERGVDAEAALRAAVRALEAAEPGPVPGPPPGPGAPNLPDGQDPEQGSGARAH